MTDPVTAALESSLVLATTHRTIGLAIVVLLAVAGLVFIWTNSRSARAELGSELELAPNRKPYVDDETLEGPILDKVLGAALFLIVVIAVTLPLYWLAEPGRHSGANEAYEGPDGIFVNRGESLFIDLGCADCHGGVQGGFREHILMDADGDFLAQVQWAAPALNAVLLRHERSEVEYMLNHGRPGTPMQAFGALGGGPLTTQQVDNIIDYLESVTLTPEQARAEVSAEIERSLVAGEFDSLGEAVFNIGLYSNFAGGAYSCGRCHTTGWSYGEPQEPGGGGTLGFSLRDGATLRRFPSAQDHFDFVAQGSRDGVGYGFGGQGSGRMPGYAEVFTEEQIAAVVEYERGL